MCKNSENLDELFDENNSYFEENQAEIEEKPKKRNKKRFKFRFRKDVPDCWKRNKVPREIAKQYRIVNKIAERYGLDLDPETGHFGWSGLLATEFDYLLGWYTDRARSPLADNYKGEKIDCITDFEAIRRNQHEIIDVALDDLYAPRQGENMLERQAAGDFGARENCLNFIGIVRAVSQLANHREYQDLRRMEREYKSAA
jgi:hypothetical protein